MTTGDEAARPAICSRKDAEPDPPEALENFDCGA
jgi:hypothetical protein